MAIESILVVSDDADSLRSLTCMLSTQGYSLESASSKAAVTSLAAHQPDLILMEPLAGGDGLEFCRRVIAQQANGAIPIILCGAFGTPEYVAVGVVDFVAAPFRRHEVLSRVRTHLELRRLRTGIVQQAEAADRESEERFRNLADTVRVPIWQSGPDKRFTFVNRSWLEFTARNLEQEIGFGWADNVHPDDLDRCLSIYSGSFNARRPFKMEYRLRRADGQYRWLLFEGAPRVHSGGAFAGYVGCCSDINDARTTQQEAFSSQRVESLRLLAGGIAHDLTNLMGTILVTLEEAEVDLAEGASVKGHLRTITTVADQAIEMTRELLVIAGQDKGTFELIDLSQIVLDMAAILKSCVPRHTSFEVAVDPDSLLIWGNPTQIRQLIMNLVINSAESIDGCGAIRVRAVGVDIAQDEGTRSGTPGPGRFVRLEVSDTGCGMTEEQRRRIFQPFFTTKGAGRGLGMAVVQGIVHSHGGSFSIASTPGKGTTLEILLPGAQPHSAAAGQTCFQASA